MPPSPGKDDPAHTPTEDEFELTEDGCYQVDTSEGADDVYTINSGILTVVCSIEGASSTLSLHPDLTIDPFCSDEETDAAGAWKKFDCGELGGAQLRMWMKLSDSLKKVALSEGQRVAESYAVAYSVTEKVVSTLNKNHVLLTLRSQLGFRRCRYPHCPGREYTLDTKSCFLVPAVKLEQCRSARSPDAAPLYAGVCAPDAIWLCLECIEALSVGACYGPRKQHVETSSTSCDGIAPASRTDPQRVLPSLPSDRTKRSQVHRPRAHPSSVLGPELHFPRRLTITATTSCGMRRVSAFVPHADHPDGPTLEGGPVRVPRRVTITTTTFRGTRRLLGLVPCADRPGGPTWEEAPTRAVRGWTCFYREDSYPLPDSLQCSANPLVSPQESTRPVEISPPLPVPEVARKEKEVRGAKMALLAASPPRASLPSSPSSEPLPSPARSGTIPPSSRYSSTAPSEYDCLTLERILPPPHPNQWPRKRPASAPGRLHRIESGARVPSPPGVMRLGRDALAEWVEREVEVVFGREGRGDVYRIAGGVGAGVGAGVGVNVEATAVMPERVADLA